MRNKKRSRDLPYRERDIRPNRQPVSGIDDRNNNENNKDRDQPRHEPNVERANDTGMGDAAVNDKRLTRYRSNRSTDA